MNESMWFVIAAAVVVGVLAMMVSQRAEFPYRAAGPLLTKAEKFFFFALEQACGSQYRVFIKVRIADLITVKRDGRSKGTIVALNRIAAKHVDYVLADPQSLNPVAAVELDDPSHNRRDRMRRDAFVEKAFAVAGIPLIRIKTRGRYDAQELRVELSRQLQASKAQRATVKP